MEKFDNKVYEEMVTELLSDAFYLKNRSNRGKISTIRSYSEVIVRRILNIPQNEKITLGDKNIKRELAKISNNNSLLLKAINIICDDGGDYTHTQVIESPSDELVQKIIDCLFDLYAYLLIAYFEKYTFGSNSKVLSAFSTLPPIIRYKVLNYLYEIECDNIAIIDKLVLSILKSFDKETALVWIEKRKDELVNMSSISKETRELYVNIRDERILAFIEMNMYDLCLMKVNSVGKIIERYGKPYEDFEEAIDVYRENGIIAEESLGIEEFNSIMEFIYLGRKSKLQMENN